MAPSSLCIFVVHPIFCLMTSLTLYFLIFLLLFKYSCFHFSPSSPSAPPISASYPQSYPVWLCPCVFYPCSLMTFPYFPHYLLPPPLWLLSDYSLFQCIWFYFARLFVLLIRFQLKVRSYAVSYTHLTLPTTIGWCRSRWSPYH